MVDPLVALAHHVGLRAEGPVVRCALGALVHQCSAILKTHSEELARLIALETGKALRTESRVEAARKLGISPRTLRYKIAQLRQMGMGLSEAMAE